MLSFLQGDYHLQSPHQQKTQRWILSFKLLIHLETYTHTIVIIGDSTESAERRITLEGTDGLDEVEQLLLVEEQADAVGSLGSITRHTQEQALQLNGMSLLIKSIITLP